MLEAPARPYRLGGRIIDDPRTVWHRCSPREKKDEGFDRPYVWEMARDFACWKNREKHDGDLVL